LRESGLPPRPRLLLLPRLRERCLLFCWFGLICSLQSCVRTGAGHKSNREAATRSKPYLRLPCARLSGRRNRLTSWLPKEPNSACHHARHGRGRRVSEYGNVTSAGNGWVANAARAIPRPVSAGNLTASPRHSKQNIAEAP